MINRTRLATIVRLVAYGVFSALVAQGCGSDDTTLVPAKLDGGTDHNTGGTGNGGAGTGGVVVQPDGGHKVSCGSAPPECLGDLAVRLCSPEGDWVTIPCGTGEKCAAGKCAVTQPCTAGDKKCATTNATKVCDADGSAWVITPCGDQKICKDGDCVLDVKGVDCTNEPRRCLGTKTQLTCTSSGIGYKVVDCPPTAPCGGGVCRGPICNVGEDQCGFDQQTGRASVRHCPDGVSFVETACSAGEACQFVPGTPTQTAQCVPQQAACNFTGQRVCGSPLDASVDPTTSYSECQFPPFGGPPTWLRIDCTTGSTCDPARPGCSTTCIAGETRCSADGVQVCGSDATWGATQKCSSGQACRQSGAVTLKDGGLKQPTAECVDRECALLAVGFPGTIPSPGGGFDGGFGGKPGAGGFGGVFGAGGTAGGGGFNGGPTGPATGLCDGSKIRLCSPEGALQPAVDCKTGVCRAVSTGVISGYHPGTCSNDCRPGESRCVTDGFPLYLTCSADGTWSTTYQDCKAACTTFVDSDGLRTKLCGDECVPNTTRCDGDKMQTCGAGKTWLTSVACSVGRCSTDTGTAACLADCVPGSSVCAGTLKAASDGVSAGTSASATCTSKGLLSAVPTACAGTQTCRTSKNGSTIGCVECLGPNAPGGNDSGLVDSRCALQGTGIQKCNAQNAWDTAASCGTDASCFLGTPVACGACTNVFSNGTACTETFMRQNFFQGSCQNFGQGAPRACGSTPDCCSSSCNPSGGGFAFCAPNDFSPCLAGSSSVNLGSTVPQTVNDSTLLGDDTVTPSCTPFFGAPDTVYAFTAPQSGTYSFDTFGSTMDTVISLQDAIACNEIICNDNASFVSFASRVVVDLAGGQRVLIVVDGRGDYTLHVNDVSTPVCGNNLKDGSDQCDGQDFGNVDCFQATLGALPGGFLVCLPNCSIDVSNCTNGGGPDGGVGGFGGFGGGFGGGPGGGPPGAGGKVFGNGGVSAAGAAGVIIGPPPPPPPPPGPSP